MAKKHDCRAHRHTESPGPITWESARLEILGFIGGERGRVPQPFFSKFGVSRKKHGRPFSLPSQGSCTVLTSFLFILDSIGRKEG